MPKDMGDETPPHGIERSSEYPSGRRRTMRSIISKNQPEETRDEPEVDTDPTAAGGIERTMNTGRKEGLIKPTLKLKVIKGGKED
jgi:hypothetical protein